MEEDPGFGFSARALSQSYDGALVDLDGVVYWGSTPTDGAAQSLAAARAEGMGIVFVTNNASRTPQAVVEHLCSVGVNGFAPLDVVTAADACADALAHELPAGAVVLVVGGSGLIEAVRDVGLIPTTSAADSPAAVVQGFAPDVGWPLLAEAAYAIRAGARYFATNLDLTLPTERGQAPGNGALVAAVQAATGVEPVSTGKPHSHIYNYAIARAQFTAPLGVGDRLDTDIAGARAAGIPALHVLSGVHGVRDLAAAPAPWRPTFVSAGLAGLLQPHPPVVRHGDLMACRRARAGFDGHSWRLSNPEGGAALDLVRAAVAECWRHADQGSMRAWELLPDLPVENAPHQ